MAKNKFRITEKDFLLANRKASREEEIAQHGKQILFRTTKQRSKKVYDRKRLKKAGIIPDDLPLLYFLRLLKLTCRRQTISELIMLNHPQLYTVHEMLSQQQLVFNVKFR